MPALRHAEMSRTRWDESTPNFGHLRSARDLSNRLRSTLPCLASTIVVAHSGSRPTIERTLRRVGAAVGQPQQIVVKAVLLVPHAVRTRAGSSPSAIQRSDRRTSLTISSYVGSWPASSSASSTMFWQNKAIHAVPSACSRYPPVGSGALRSKTLILSSPRKPPSNTFLPKRSLRFTHQVKLIISLLKRRLQEFEIALAAQRLLGAIEEERRPGVDRRIDVAEVPLVGGYLAVGMQVDVR